MAAMIEFAGCRLTHEQAYSRLLGMRHWLEELLDIYRHCCGKRYPPDPLPMNLVGPSIQTSLTHDIIGQVRAIDSLLRVAPELGPDFYNPWTPEMPEVELVVRKDGSIEHVHSDEATALTMELGTPTIQRASFVEPDHKGNWWADLSPIAGPKLGPYPPDARDQALADEVQWINEHYLFPRYA